MSDAFAFAGEAHGARVSRMRCGWVESVKVHLLECVCQVR